jgi:hypothetical protein
MRRSTSQEEDKKRQERKSKERCACERKRECKRKVRRERQEKKETYASKYHPRPDVMSVPIFSSFASFISCVALSSFTTTTRRLTHLTIQTSHVSLFLPCTDQPTPDDQASSSQAIETRNVLVTFG